MCRVQGGRQRDGDGGGRIAGGRVAPRRWQGLETLGSGLRRGVCVPPGLATGRCDRSQRHRYPRGASPSLLAMRERLERGWTPPATPAPGSWEGSSGPTLSCTHPVVDGVCFRLPGWKAPTASTAGWRHSGLRPFPALSPGCLPTSFGSSILTPSHLGVSSEGDAERWEAVGPKGSSCLPLPSPHRSSPRAAPLLPASSCCPQPASEEVTGSCLYPCRLGRVRKQRDGGGTLEIHVAPCER